MLFGPINAYLFLKAFLKAKEPAMKNLTIKISDKLYADLIQSAQIAHLSLARILEIFVEGAVNNSPSCVLRKYVVDSVVYRQKNDASDVCATLNSFANDQKLPIAFVVRKYATWKVKGWIVRESQYCKMAYKKQKTQNRPASALAILKNLNAKLAALNMQVAI